MLACRSYFYILSTTLFLGPKEAGKRSQLWRMTSGGMLQHEGSSPPQDPGASKDQMIPSGLVLDIAGPAVQPHTYVPLMLRKPDDRRQLTQKWRFIEGRLMCSHRGLFCQAKDGFAPAAMRGRIALTFHPMFDKTLIVVSCNDWLVYCTLL